jgi:hypothetical protein
MALTLADIQRWDATAICDVSTALAKRGASAKEVKAGLGKLPLIATARQRRGRRKGVAGQAERLPGDSRRRDSERLVGHGQRGR